MTRVTTSRALMGSQVLEAAAERLLPVHTEDLVRWVNKKPFGITLTAGGGIVPGFITGMILHIMWKVTQVFGAYRSGQFTTGALPSPSSWQAK